MLKHPTIEKLRALRLMGMLKALEQQEKVADIHTLSFEERLGLLVDHELTERENRQLASRLKAAKLKQSACIENIDFRQSRGLDRNTITHLATGDWIAKKHNLLITGPTGSGKTYLTCAFSHKACQQGFKTRYVRAPRFFSELELARAAGTYNKFLTDLAKLHLLAIDDFGLVPLSEDMARDLLEVIDDRSGSTSTLLASQLPHESWHQTITNPTLADAILDRVVHNSYKLKLKCKESMRKTKETNE